MGKEAQAGSNQPSRASFKIGEILISLVQLFSGEEMQKIIEEIERSKKEEQKYWFGLTIQHLCRWVAYVVKEIKTVNYEKEWPVGVVVDVKYILSILENMGLSQEKKGEIINALN